MALSAPNVSARRLAEFAVAVASVTAGPPARAEPAASLVLARPIGASFAGGRVGRGPIGGPLLGVEGDWATILPASTDSAEGSPAFGVRAGWAFENGVAVHIRYDDLGVEPASSRMPLQLATVGLRYSLPFSVPIPFAEVDAGPAFVLGDTRFGAGAALGASIPIGPYVLIDATGRDWLVPVADTLRQTITAGVGLTILLPSPAGR